MVLKIIIKSIYLSQLYRKERYASDYNIVRFDKESKALELHFNRGDLASWHMRKHASRIKADVTV